MEVVARLFDECWCPGRLDLVPEILDPDIVWTAIESAPDFGTRRGRAECLEHMNDWLGSFDLEMAIEEARSTSDGRLVCALRLIATQKRTGLTTEYRYGAAFRSARDGRVVEIHEYASYTEALEAVGLSQ
jgi:ketosteroid isomerase-like protein